MLEAGNLNVPALAGWSAALAELQSDGLASRTKQAAELSQQMHLGLSKMQHLRVYSTAGALPIASLAIEGLSPADAALILDAEYGVEARSGMHCAALIHEFLGSEQEGTLRLSAGHTSTASDIDVALAAIEGIVRTLNPE